MPFLDLVRSFHLMILIFLLGCMSPPTEGLYEGTLFKKINGNTISEKNVRIQLTFDQEKLFHMSIRNSHHEIIDTIYFHQTKVHNKVKLKIPSLSPENFKLTLVKTKNSKGASQCFQALADYHFSFCLGSTEFALSVTDQINQSMVYFLTGRLAAQQVPIPHETPKNYLLSELVQRVLAKNFDTLIEYQRVLEAKQAAKAAYLNLLPHFAYKDILAIAGLNPMSIASWVADFVPFLIPTRWMKTREANDLSAAEQITFALLKADLINHVQSLAYTYEHDLQILKYLQKFLQTYQPIYDHMLEISQSDVGISGNPLDELVLRLVSIMNTAHQEIIRVEKSIALDKTALSSISGFQNPFAISDVNIEEAADSIEHAPEIQMEDVVPIALERSLELKQIDYLIHNAKEQRKEFYFNWTDPDVPASQNISFSLIPYIAKASAFIQELMIQRQKIQNKVQTEAENAVITYTAALNAYHIVKVGLDRLRQRDQTIQADLLKAKTKTEIQTTAGNMQWMLNLEGPFKTNFYDAITNFRIARSQIKRLLLEDTYSSLENEVSPIVHLPYGF